MSIDDTRQMLTLIFGIPAVALLAYVILRIVYRGNDDE